MAWQGSAEKHRGIQDCLLPSPQSYGDQQCSISLPGNRVCGWHRPARKLYRVAYSGHWLLCNLDNHQMWLSSSLKSYFFRRFADLGQAMAWPDVAKTTSTRIPPPYKDPLKFRRMLSVAWTMTQTCVGVSV